MKSTTASMSRFHVVPQAYPGRDGLEVVKDYLMANAEIFLIVATAIAVVIVYWLQNNIPFGNLCVLLI